MERYIMDVVGTQPARKSKGLRETRSQMPRPTGWQEVCDHGAPCGCYAEGHAAGLAAARFQSQRVHG